MKKRSKVSAAPAIEVSPLDKATWWTLLALLAAFPAVVGILRNPGGSLAFFSEPYQPPKLLILSVLLTAASVLWLVEVGTGGRVIRWGRPFAAAGVFALIILVSTAFAPEPLASLFGTSDLLTGAITWLMSLWLGFLVAQYVTTGKRLTDLSWAHVGGAVFVAVVALLQAMGLDPLATPFSEQSAYMVRQGSSTLGNPNYTALYLVIPLVVSVGLSVAAQRSGERWTAAGCATVILTAMLITLTRASWIGAAAGVLVLALMLPRDPKMVRRVAPWVTAGLLGVMTLSALLVGRAALNTRVSLFGKGLTALLSGRPVLWMDTLQSIAARPLLGTGLDRLSLGVYPFQSGFITVGTNRFIPQDPHSLPLLVAGSVGVLGAITLFAYLGWALVVAYKTASAAQAAKKPVVYLAWIGGAAGFLLASMASVYTTSAVFTLGLMGGVLLAPTLKPAASRTWVVAVAGAVALSIMLSGMFGAVQNARASRLTMRAQFGDSENNYRRALTLIPWDTRTQLTYLWGKIGSYREVLTSGDKVAVAQTLKQLDGEVQLQIARTPGELLLYRMRIDLYRIPQGTPAFDEAALEAAIDDALRAFPDDEEFNRWKQELP